MRYGAAPPRPTGRSKTLLIIVALAGALCLYAFTGTFGSQRVVAGAPPRPVRASGASPPQAVRAPAAPAAAHADDAPPQRTAPVRESRDARPRGPAADFQRALEYHRAGDLDNAARAYRALVARGELAAQSHNNLGLAYHQQGRLDAAAREFEHALARDPEYSRAYNNAGVVLLAQGQVERAMQRFRTAAALTPHDPDPIVNLALAHQAAGRRERARETLLSALGLSPHSAAAHYNLAVLYDQTAERTRAREHYRAFLEHRGAEYAARAADVRARLAVLDRRR